MEKYTQAEFDAMPRDEYGIRYCPTGDYTLIRKFDDGCHFGGACRFGNGCHFDVYCNFDECCSFGAGCSFGECCRFGEQCDFGEACSHESLTNSRYFACDRIGSERRKTYFFAADEGMYVRAGYFFGALEEFVERVQKMHGGTRYEKEYLAAVELAKIVLEDDE